MKVFCSPAHRGHAPRGEYGRGGLNPYPESPARVDAILRGLAEADLDDVRAPAPRSTADLLTVHTGEYLGFLEEAHGAWELSGGRDELAAAVFAPRWGGRRPADRLGQVGWYGFDTTP
ncbi:MAG: hypothetical protein ABIL09_28555, partial [Gemmatimonadota bacterium]